jgi:hypothetical protein
MLKNYWRWFYFLIFKFLEICIIFVNFYFRAKMNLKMNFKLILAILESGFLGVKLLLFPEKFFNLLSISRKKSQHPAFEAPKKIPLMHFFKISNPKNFCIRPWHRYQPQNQCIPNYVSRYTCVSQNILGLSQDFFKKTKNDQFF